MWHKTLSQTFKKEAYMITIFICLFFIPLFYNPFFVQSFNQGKELLFRFILVVALAAAAIAGLVKKRFTVKPFMKSPLFFMLTLGACVVVLADAFSPTPVITLYGTMSRGFGLITQGFLFAFILFCADGLDKEKIKKSLHWAFLGGAVVAIYGLLQKVWDPLFGGYDKDLFVGRVFSFLGNPGYLGQFMLLQIVIGCYLLITEEKRKNKWLYFFGILMAFAALWLSETRGALLALVPCGVLILIKYRKQCGSFLKKLEIRKKVAIIYLLVLIGIIAIVTVPKDKFSLSDDALRSLHSRFQIWNGAVELIVQRPWFGYGGETFSVYAPEIITREFLTLEQDIHLSIDRIHNEFLETFFSYGFFGAALYLAFFGAVLIFFLKENEPAGTVLCLLVMTNMLQNQFTFSDISIAVLVSFCIGGLISLQITRQQSKNYEFPSNVRNIMIPFILAVSGFVLYFTVYLPTMSQLAYGRSQKNYAKSYETAVLDHKEALAYTPYYSELWYQLMLLDPSSLKTALGYLEKIEGDSGNVLAWYGNYYSQTDPSKASDYFIAALRKNPDYPDWLRAFGDMLYKNGDNEDALLVYKRYLDASPPFWQWKDTLSRHSPEEQKAYRIFFKNVPDFWNTVERVNLLQETLNGASKPVVQ